MKSKYSQWLIVSDIDGTLNNKQRKLPPNNKKAINNFVNNGGYFTLCSGRNLSSLDPHYKKLGITTPAICMNGAGIYDYSTSSVLYYKPISSQGERVIFDLFNKYFAQLTVFDMNTVYRYKSSCIYGLIVSALDKLPCKLCKAQDELPTGQWGKVTFFSSHGVCKKIRDEIKEKYNDLFEWNFTSPFTLELMEKGVNKGSGVAELVKLININPENVGAIGDYYNDEAMLKSVSHPACCGQAPDDLKELCEYVTCHCNDGAVSDFINYIEKNYIL